MRCDYACLVYDDFLKVVSLFLDAADGFAQVRRIVHILKIRQVLQLAEVDTCIRIPHANDVKLKVLATTF